MPRLQGAWFGVAVAFLLSTAEARVVYARTDDVSILLREDKPDGNVYSHIYIASTTDDTKLEEGNLPVQAVISLPLPDSAPSLAGLPARFQVAASFRKVTDNKPYRLKGDHVELMLTKEQSDYLVRYLGNYNPGERFEPVLEVKNLLVNRVETTFIGVVPVGLTLEFDAENSAFLNGEVVFKVTYVPRDMQVALADVNSWEVSQDGSKPQLRSVKYEDLETKREVNVLKLSIEDLVASGAGKLTFSPKTASLVQGSLRLGINTAARLNFQTAEVERRFVPTQTITNLRSAPRTGPRPRPVSFSFGSPIVPEDYPVYARAEFTSSKNATGGRDRIVGLDLNINVDPDADSLSPLRAFEIAGVNGLTFAPAFKMKMSNVLSSDNENSLRWFAPIGYNAKNGPKCSKDGCSKPFFRGATFFAGLNGEHSAYNQNQNMVVPVGTTLYFRNVNTPARKNWETSLDVLLGYEFGKVIDTTSAAYFEVGDDRQQVALTPVQKTAIRRLHGQAKVSVGLGKNRSFNFSWDRWQLQKEEQFLKAREIEGSFAPGSAVEIGGQTVTSVPDQKLTVYDPEYRKGFRHYFSGKFLWELAPHVSVDLTYAKGELAPAFQHVNKITAGIAYQIKP